MRMIALFIVAALAIPTATYAQVHVRGYVNKNGTYVAPYYRSSPNSTKLDNYSTKGNINPYTGSVGTKNPYPNPYSSNYGSLGSSSSSSSSSYGSYRTFGSSSDDAGGSDPE